MKIIETGFSGLFKLEPTVHCDDRGYFFEVYSKPKVEGTTIDCNWLQDNESFSFKGTLRGLHFQRGKFSQAKLVRVVLGVVLDVVVDLRTSSKTFGKHYSVVLSNENKHQLFIPRGFAHGFCVLSENAIFSYKVDNHYNKESECGILFNDPDLNIDWGLPNKEIKLSEKDYHLPLLKDLKDELF
jgi:dTDP-4-dehydrorhamnose 3,5-epimerase